MKRPYEKAVIHRELKYEPIVWATADGEDLYRNIESMYDSYKAIIKQIDNQEQILLARDKFSQHIRQLKSNNYGEILESIANRPGWYIYKEKMLRGYVRMQAEANEIKLLGEKEAPRQKMRTPNNARTGDYGSSIPKDVKFANQRNTENEDNDKKNKRDF